MKVKKKGVRFSKTVSTDEYSSCISCPEYVALHMAETTRSLGDYKNVVEMCSCVGALCIQLAKHFENVIGIELSEDRVIKSRYNAALYGVSDNTNFVVGDVLDEKLLATINANVAFLDPEWSRVKMDRSTHVQDVDDTQPSLKELIRLTKKHITDEIVIRFPEKMDFETFEKCDLGPGKIETIVINNMPVFKVGYFLKSITENTTEEIRFD